jgi:hypothetical protein
MKNSFLLLFAGLLLLTSCGGSNPSSFNEKIVDAQTIIVKGFQDFNQKVDGTDKSQLSTLEPERKKLEDRVKAELDKLKNVPPVGAGSESFKTNALHYFEGIASLISNEYKKMLRPEATADEVESINKVIIEKNNVLVDEQSKLIAEQEDFGKQNNFEIK